MKHQVSVTELTRTMRKSLPVLILTCGCLMMMFTGCKSPTIKTTRVVSAPINNAKGPIKVYQLGEPPPGGYEILGVVSGGGAGHKRGSHKSTLKKLKAEAAAMGADALLGYYTYTERDLTEAYLWSSALAIRSLPPGQTPPPRKGDFIVAIPHVQFNDDVFKGDKARKLDELSRRLIQYNLLLKGYYAVLADETAPEPFETKLNEMDENSRSRYGGAQADLVFGLRVLAKKGLNIILVGSEGLTLETTLYSKAQRGVIWQSTGTGAGAAGFMMNALLPTLKSNLAIQKALEKAFETLPDICQTL